MLTFDIETDGLLGKMTRIHCLCIHNDNDGGFPGEVEVQFVHPNIHAGVKMLQEAKDICGHNIVQFDIPAIQKIYPWFAPKGKIHDTTIMSRLGCPDLKELDFAGVHGSVPNGLMGRHSLEAWGYRLGLLKGDYGKQGGAWESFTPEMLEYCKQDVRVTVALHGYLSTKVSISDKALDLETRVAQLISRQELFGVCFDQTKAWQLYTRLCDEKERALVHLRTLFPPMRRLVREFVAKVNNSSLGYVKGQLVQKFEDVEFNPGSNDHVEYWLRKRHDWKPSEFTETGLAKIDEEILSDLLHLPEVPSILRYRMLTKRISQLADGEQGWLKRVAPDGQIHGSVIPCGAITRRMTHNSPNMGQVPACSIEFGPECRELFSPPPGYVMVGCDASQLELRTLAHLMHKYDGGVYAKAATTGTKANQDDIHCINSRAFGVDRDTGKTMFYALAYGAGDEKLGRIKNRSWDAVENRRVGRECRANLMRGLPALKRLLDVIQAVYRSKGFFTDADGQEFKLRSTHAAFNTINQRLGAIVMKRASVILDDKLRASGLKPGVDYEFMLTVHDEWQLAVIPGSGRFVGETAVASIREAGEYYGLKCPLDGDYRIGGNWRETH